ncbi:MAG: MFS transporter [Pseudomonadota bacterium]
MLLRNRSLRWLMTGYIIIVIAYGVGIGLGLYTFTFFWELTGFQTMIVLLTGPFGSLFGYLLAGKLFAWLDKRNAMMAGAIAWMVLHALPVCLYLLGLTPAAGSWALAILLAAIYLLLGACVAQVFVGISTLIADIADENALATGTRQEGVLFGAVSFASKCISAGGSVIAGLMLRLIEWPTGATIRSGADVAPETLHAMAVLSGPVAASIAIPGILCLLGYGLNRERTLAIQAELRARELAAPSTA